MNNFKEIIKEEKRLCLYTILKYLLIIEEEIVSFFSRLPKIIGLSCFMIGFVCSIQIILSGYPLTALKAILLTSAIGGFMYFALLLINRPFINKIFEKLEAIRTSHHNYNCGIYMEKYKIRTFKENNLDSMLSLRKLLETNILLSGLQLKTKLIFDDNKNLDYKNILSNGLNMGMALCFSPTANIENKEFVDNNKEFVIENDAFLKEFSKFCEENPDDIEKQIEFLKQTKKELLKK